MNSLVENTELMSVAIVVIPAVVQFIKQKIDLDPRIINGLVSGVFALIVVLVQIGIAGLSASEVAANIWAYFLTTWTLGTAMYELVHKKKESTEASL